ncbi:MAG: site-specific integrase [Bacteroidaceae bacterium]|nr:site-specific integrase [Bacteroidaceae bacterium]
MHSEKNGNLARERRKALSYDHVEKFRLPQFVRTAKSAYVYYYVLDPASVTAGEPRLVRLKKKFGRYSNRVEQKQAALRFCQEIGLLLQRGWNPLVESSGSKGMASWSDAMSKYLAYIVKKCDDGAMRPDSLANYRSRINRLDEFIKTMPVPLTYVYQFNRTFVEEYLDYCYVEHCCSPATRNNYLSWLQSLSGWLVGHGYISKDPTAGIEKLRAGDKQRKALTSTDMSRLREYLQVNDRHYLLACMVHYYTLVRPKEMSFIRLRDISIKEQTLFISGTVSKNHKDGKVTLPAVVILLMIDLHVFDNPSDYFLFGRGFRPSAEQGTAKQYRDRWAKVRKACDFPKNYKFYSLKDTGITDTVERVGLVVAKDQARHSNIATTNRYIRKEQLRAQPELKNYEGQL